MKGIALKVFPRIRKGSAEARRLRREGFIPAILYGSGENAIELKVPKKEFSKILHSRAGEHSMVELQIEEDGGEKTMMSVIKKVQHDPVTDLIIHADFERIQMDRPMAFTVPIQFVGTPAGAKKGGVFAPHLHEIAIICKPIDAPETIEIDVSGIDLGASLHMKDISIPNATIAHPLEETIASVVKPRGLVEEAAPAEGEAEEVEGEKEEEEKEKGEGKKKESEKE